MDKQIFLDMDGVIVDLMVGIEAFFFCKLDHSDYNINFMKDLGYTREDFWNKCTSLFWASLPKTLDANVILSIVEPYKPVILSSPPNSGVANSFIGKTSWVKHNLPEYYKEGRYFFGVAKHLLAHPDAILIDDHEVNIEAFVKAGGKGILVPRPWNYLRDEIPALHIQTELIKLLGDEY